MAWIRACAAPGTSNFPWDAKVLAGFNATQLTATGNSSVTFQSTIKSPKIASACYLTATVSSVTVELTAYLSVDNGSTWQQFGSMVSGSPAATVTGSLSSYANQEILIRLVAKNATSGSHIMTMTSCSINV